MFLDPGAAVPAMVKFALICVLAAFTTIPVTVIPVPALIVVPVRVKLVPTRVTAKVALFRAPRLGVIDVSVGAGGLFTVKATPLLVPPAVVTVMFLEPVVAMLVMLKLAVIWVPAAFTVMPLTKMPNPALIVVPA